MDADEEDFVFYGTPVEREEDFSSRKKKAVAESSSIVRSLPVWKQEVTDEEGRRRFHGAFTGGFSAGYYNTAGSKEGWTPQTFVSSRKSRAEVKQQSILNFLDEDEKSELAGRSLKTSSQFDTFGLTSAEVARKQAEKEQQKRPSAIPGPVPDEFIVPATESIGVKLLRKMGWRHGHSIKDSHTSSLYEARREARKAFLAFAPDEAKAQNSNAKPTDDDLENIPEQAVDAKSSRSTPVYVLNPKQDLHGLGYDPYKNAPEFREKKRLRTSGGRENVQERALLGRESLFGFKSGNIAPGFGIGALEELDAEDEDVYASGYNFEESLIEEAEEPSKPSLDMQHSKLKLKGAEHDGILSGFKPASKSDYQLERFEPPKIPKDFKPHHKFPGPLEINQRLLDPPPLEVPPPQDGQIRVLIDGVASLVARCGKSYEDLSKEKNQSDPRYNFLKNGGEFHDYYSRKLWEERQKRNQTKPLLEVKVTSEQKMTAENRGRILGEKPLGRSSAAPTLSDPPVDLKLQNNRVDTFTKPAVLEDLLNFSKPFKDDPPKQERFEQFLKDKYRGGLRTIDSGSNNMSENARARERLDFEAAAEAMEKKARMGKENTSVTQTRMEFSAGGTMQFTAGGVEQVKPIQAEEPVKKVQPKREEFQWRPSPILCKRFDLIDPYMGKPPPPPRARSKMDSLFFMPDLMKASGSGETAVAKTKWDQLSEPQSKDVTDDVVDKEPEIKAEIENVERPVDLYKAIFSDDSEEEEETETPITNNAENPEKKVEAANAVLNRLIAGDFLESLGKELGLEVPPDLPPPNKTKIPPQKEAVEANSKNPVDTSTEDNSTSMSLNPHIPEDTKVGLLHLDDREVEKSSNRHREVRNGSLSSEDEKSRRRRGSRKDRDYSSSDSSEDSQDRHHSSSKKRKKEHSSREKRSNRSRKHSKSKHHHKHRRSQGDSPERSRHRSSERDRSESKREKRRNRD